MQIEKNVANSVLFLTLLILACKLTAGLFAVVIALIGCLTVFGENKKWTVICSVILPLLPSFSPILVSSTFLGVTVRIGQIILIICMLVSQSTHMHNDSIPIGGLFIYSIVAIISSVSGWMPLISFFKILNFVIFIINIILIGYMMQESIETLYQLRICLLGVAFFIIVGSIITYFIPSIGYSMEIQKAGMWGIYTTGAEVKAKEWMYFSGVMNHSQTLATNVPLWFAWSLCDLLIIERKKTWIHVAIIIVAPFVMYLTRSRTTIIVLCISLFMIWRFILPKTIHLVYNSIQTKKLFFSIVGVLFITIIGVQIYNQTLSRWLRKKNYIENDQRSIIEAVTESRMGLVKYNLNDFRLNPIFGKGFQVMNWHEVAYQQGQISLLSAPIEKGVLPLMVLGETGCIGFIVFCAFLIQFDIKCIEKQYTILMCLFTALLAANMSEASFFSPGGGILHWTTTVIGGFCLDMITKRNCIGNIKNVYA